MKCPSCGVYLSKSEAKSGCPLCDWTPQREARLNARRAANGKQPKRRKETGFDWAEIEDHRVYGYATRLTRYLIDQYEDEIPCWKDEPVIWRNRRGSYHAKDHQNGGDHYLVYGYQNFDDTHRDGMLEYKTWRWIWRDGLKDGLEGVYQVVLHEFAHALQSERNGRHYGKAHTMVWADAVIELQTLVPFEDTTGFQA